MHIQSDELDFIRMVLLPVVSSVAAITQLTLPSKECLFMVRGTRPFRAHPSTSPPEVLEWCYNFNRLTASTVADVPCAGSSEAVLLTVLSGCS